MARLLDSAVRVFETKFDFSHLVAASISHTVGSVYQLGGPPEIQAFFQPDALLHADNRGNSNSHFFYFGTAFNRVYDLHFLQTVFVHFGNARFSAQSKRRSFHHFGSRAAQTVDYLRPQVVLLFEFDFVEGRESRSPCDPSRTRSPLFWNSTNLTRRIHSPIFAYCVCRPPRRPAIMRSSKPSSTVLPTLLLILSHSPHTHSQPVLAALIDSLYLPNASLIG